MVFTYIYILVQFTDHKKIDNIIGIGLLRTVNFYLKVCSHSTHLYDAQGEHARVFG